MARAINLARCGREQRLYIRPMTATAPSLDLLRPFQLETSQLRGRVLRLGPAIDSALGAHDYPAPVSRLLGELLVLAGAFAGALKFEGTFSLQTRGSGPVRLMVADVTNDGTMRAYAGFDRNRLEGPAEPRDFADLIGKAVLALTVDQRTAGGEAYQGIVPLEGETLTAGMLTYFHQSEQVPTGICSAVGRDPRTRAWRAGAIVLQAMPGEGAIVAREREEDWHRAMLLLQTVTEAELVDPALPLDDLLVRLFHEEGVRVFDPTDLRFGCSCSDERVRRTLSSFSVQDLADMREPDGQIGVTCQFCGSRYHYDDATIMDIVSGEPAPQRH